MSAPVVLFAYRRPDHLRRALVALAANPEAAHSPLVVFCDGARDSGAEGAVAEVRRVAHAAKGFASVEVVEREHNLGLMTSITEGVTRVTRAHESAIVVEDDLVVAPRFLEFMNLALERYASEPRVMQISGYMYPCELRGAAGSGFLPSISCWGWATWDRSWRAYDPSASAWDRLRADPAAKRRFDMDGGYDYSGMIESVRRGTLESWGVVWYLSVFSRGGLVLYPRKSLVTNTGFDGSGTHGGGDLGAVALWRPDGAFELPERLDIDPQYYGESRRAILASQKGWRHWLRRLQAR